VSDRKILAFVATQQLVVAAHVQTLLADDTGRHTEKSLATLAAAGQLRRGRFFPCDPGHYQITTAGLNALGSDLPPPRLDLRSYRHDIGVAWLHLAAAAGTFGRVETVLPRRQLESHDQAHQARGSTVQVDDRRDPPRPPVAAGRPLFGARLQSAGQDEAAELHYPDLLLIAAGNQRVAVELELTSNGRRRREMTLARYGANPNITAVLCLSDDPAIRSAIKRTAARLGLSDLVRVQHFAARRTNATPKTR
jgi:hypothetical protein